MQDLAISRRAALMGAGAAAAWLASPARALLQAAGKLDVPAFVDQLIGRMTLEEKAGQLQLMAAAWGGGAALTLNPPGNSSNFEAQVHRGASRTFDGCLQRKRRAHGADHADRRGPAIAAEDPADLRGRHHPRPPHHLPGTARRSRQLRARPSAPDGGGGSVRGIGRRDRLDLFADGRRRARPALGQGSRRRGRGPAARTPLRRRAGPRVPGCRSQVDRAYARLHQAFRRLRRWRIRPRLQCRRYLRGAAARGLSAAVQGRVRRWCAVGHGLVQRDQRRSIDRQPLADDGSLARPVGVQGLRRVRLHRRRGNDRRGIRQGRARRCEAGVPRRSRHEHAERPLSSAFAGPGARRRGTQGAARRIRASRAGAQGQARPVRRPLPPDRRETRGCAFDAAEDSCPRARSRTQIDRHAQERRRPPSACRARASASR